ncbi:MAG: dTDP-4-dehydrorhamnose reductase [Oceanicaulis sp.]
MARAPLHILQFGATGQVARCLSALADDDLKVTALPRAVADLTDDDAVQRVIHAAPSDTAVIVNLAAYTGVDAAESDRDKAFAVNGRAPGVMAKAARARGLPFIHLSTDYVFDGSGSQPYRETDRTRPLGVYGASKHAGEVAVMEASPDAVIMRTAWVFSAHGNNFVRTMVRLAAERAEISVVDDQIGCPTPAAAIADAVVSVGRTLASQHRPADFAGIFHYCGDRTMSWCGFADAIFERLDAAGLKRPHLYPIPTSAYPTPASRPAYSVLDCTRINDVYGVKAADSLAGLDSVIAKILK